MKNSYCRFKSTLTTENRLANSSIATTLLMPPDSKKVILNGKITLNEVFLQRRILSNNKGIVEEPTFH